MNIIKTDFVAGAQQAEGIVVIIDVFRAFSVACYCLDKGAASITPVAAIEDALALKQNNLDMLLIGEREGKPLEGFNFGNSPSAVLNAEIAGKHIAHTTHAGTQGLTNAPNADEVLTGSFLNAAATARYILSKQPETVTLVRMGWKAETNTEEDDLCAEYLESLLLGTQFDAAGIRDTLANSPCAERFFDPGQPWNPQEDFELCLNIDMFDFAVRAEHGADQLLKLKAIQA